MDISRRFPRLTRAALALLVSGAFVTTAGVGGAAADLGDIDARSLAQCGSGRICLWGAAGFAGTFWSTASSGTVASGITTAGSVWNRRGTAVRLYSGAGGTGSWTCFAAGEQIPTGTYTVRSVTTMSSASC